MKEASVMISTKYKDDDNNNHNDDNNASKLCSIMFLSRPKHLPPSDHSIFKGGWSGVGCRITIPDDAAEALRSVIRVLPRKLHKAGSRNQDTVPWPSTRPSFKFVCRICFLGWEFRIPDSSSDLGSKTELYLL